MANIENKLLPVGTSDFSTLRLRNQIYVDKTELIYQIASQSQKFFFARPRRFGKSLLISTFESLFKYGLRDFKGLAIENLWKEKCTYNVVSLDFSVIPSFSSVEEFSKKFMAILGGGFSPFGFNYVPDPLNDFFDQLFTWMRAQPRNSLVILIDEYDAPLTGCLNNKDLFESVRAVMANFYAILKSNDRVLRFAFITGITKFNKASIFSGLNNLSDLSLDVNYGSLLGYTPYEVEKYFSEFLSRAAKKLCRNKDELFTELINRYDGFCFERSASIRVFSPWSLLQFLSSPENGLIDYWFESGGRPSVLIEYLKSHSLRNPEEYGREKTISLSELSGASDIEILSDIGLLTQTGYLTIKSVRFGNTVYLDYPNVEVRTAMAQHYTSCLLNGRTAGEVGAGSIAEVLREDSAESVFHILNRLFLSIDFQGFPVRDEASVRAYVQVYIAGAGLNPKIEHHNAHGRSDLEVGVGDRHWVFEFKVVRKGESKEEKLRAGVEQMTSKHYGEQQSSPELKRVVLVYSIEERQFVKWHEVVPQP
ncbi:AAA family ATPase [uncultured Parasutterella sp.]|uniref:AAA family ATPase n=2 Tax=uncultured Parasutterella sp. TaxID=1263098 RepID=UPI00272BA562|nr:AAA family ATPase [uncultured Parasutterella sp.]